MKNNQYRIGLVVLSVLMWSFSVVKANMASPLVNGVGGGCGYTSREIDVLRERLLIRLAPDGNSALFVAEYHIRTSVTGMQIPLVFHAVGLREGFLVTVDGKPVEVFDVPAGTVLAGFVRMRDSLVSRYGWMPDSTEIQRNPEIRNEPHYDFRYFEVNLPEGEHVIEVRFTAKAWLDRAQTIVKKGFDYALYPARFWKSFGPLEVVLESDGWKGEVETNLGQSSEALGSWKLDRIPADYIRISLKPPVSKLAATLLALGSGGLGLLMIVILLVLHLVAIIYHRKRRGREARSWVVVVGSLVIPFAGLLAFLVAERIIDAALGEAASHYYGYTFVLVIFYPVAMPLYWLVMWGVDWFVRKMS